MQQETAPSRAGCEHRIDGAIDRAASSDVTTVPSGADALDHLGNMAPLHQRSGLSMYMS